MKVLPHREAKMAGCLNVTAMIVLGAARWIRSKCFTESAPQIVKAEDAPFLYGPDYRARNLEVLREAGPHMGVQIDDSLYWDVFGEHPERVDPDFATGTAQQLDADTRRELAKAMARYCPETLVGFAQAERGSY